MNHIEHHASDNNETRTLRCRELNDQFRKTFLGGTIVATQGVQALDEKILNQLRPAIQSFDAFIISNDPHREHDFGEVNISGV